MFHFGKSWYTPPCFSERVRKELKAKRLEGKMLCTQNGRVRNEQEGKEIEEVEEVKEEGPATPSEPRTAGERWRSRGREG